ncbi:uncharacterized protein LOC105762916 [Gossypium raimondii]|uniref:Uncharacterized protein n=2 Tax=Gossypium raimondii TaxID=29730 RepID=A0A0D2TWF7_GOSRA|nr:uncharacterized protein LOC105762916 [Gossypium raimondii]KJB47618.1 hypothetical protein B456_008G034000 [Gossypium raimondii]KJB47619.1 hypothetical protein B456_008G034000 [Gossypium raimondii]KJB47620.1 hypothetical protein B456_008G034000 [Gossypium raimondii]
MAAATKSVDRSLWWEPFSSLLTDLENASPSDDLPEPLAKKLKENHDWFVETVARFKSPNEKSKEALMSSEQIKIGPHELTVKPDFRDKALQVSSYLCLDEVQSYILVDRYLERGNVAENYIVHDPIHVVLLQYFIERQCLLKCTRQILMHALYLGNSLKEESLIREEALKLIYDGLEGKLISVLEVLMSCSHPEQMDVDLFTLWAEETLLEDNLVLDIIFLIYYESLCTCTAERWKNLCLLYKVTLSGSYNFGKLAISPEALSSFYQAKIQLLLILIEALNLENLLHMVHDEIPFRQGACGFTLTDVREIDALMSGFDVFEMREGGPLILAWAVFLCLMSSLPQKEESNEFMEIDHVGYVRQAFEASSLSYFLEILQSGILKESDGPVAGYRSVLRTFISAFIASYEISLQEEDGTLNLILGILCYVYRGEESLCIQFWDRASFTDGPIRCLLCNLEGEFPFRTVELLRLLSSLCEGSWPAECVYNFLDKSTGISSLFDITSESLLDNVSQIVETQHPVPIPGIDGLHIPSRTHGHVLKVVDGRTALVRWEHTKSAVFVLLLRLAQIPYLENNEEAFLTLDLLSRMVSCNTAVCFALMDSCNICHLQATGMNGQIENNVWVVEIISNIVRNLSPNPSGAALMSMAFVILAKMLKCCPSNVAAVALKANIFDVASNSSTFNIGWNGLSSGSWLLSGKLAKMLLIDSEQNDYDCPLTISVLDFTMELVRTGVEDDIVVSLIVFSLQYILVNHEYWKYKVKNTRWKVTLKVLEVMKTCILATASSEKLSDVIRDLLLDDSSIHNTLFRIMCTTSEALERLYLNRLIELVEIEGLQLAISSALDISYVMLTKISKDMTSSIPAFHQAVLSSTTKPISVIAAVISLISFFRDLAIQVAAAKLLAILLQMAEPHPFINSCFCPDDKRMADLRLSINRILLEHRILNDDLFIAVLNLLASAARFQPAFLLAIFDTKEDTAVQLANIGGVKQTTNEPLSGSLGSETCSLVNAILQFVESSNDVINSNPCVLLNALNFLKALWHGAGLYTTILERLKSSDKFWKQLSNSIFQSAALEVPVLKSIKESEASLLGHKYRCQSAILETMAYDVFLMKKLLYAESLVKDPSESNKKIEADNNVMKSILSNWCNSSVLGSLIKSYTSCKYDNEIYFHAKVALSLLTVHIMGKLVAGDAGSLSVSLVEKIRHVYKKLTVQPAFSELLAQYSLRGYSEGKELKALIMSDLYYHLQGELEGRKMSAGPFKELSQFLIESKIVKIYENKCSLDLFLNADDVHVFDLGRIQADLGLDMWDYSEWRTSKGIAETMLSCMQKANSMVLIGNSKLSSLKALITVLTVYEDSLLEKMTEVGGKIPDQLIFSCMEHICRSFLDTLEPLSRVPDVSEDVLDFLTSQADLLLHLTRSVRKSLSMSVCLLLLKTSGTGLKMLNDLRTIVSGVNNTMKLLIMLILLSMEFCWLDSHISGVKDKESIEGFAEISNVSLGLLPILCNCVTVAECHSLCLTALDLTLKGFLTPDTWFPIIHKHLQLQHVVLKLQDKNSFGSVPVLLKFFLTIARVRGGAEMLLNAGFFSSLKLLFADMSDGRVSSVINSGKKLSTLSDKIEKPQLIWGLGLAVITAMVHSLGDSSLSIDIVANVIPYLFSEKAHLISYFLSAPDFPSDDHDKKRPRAQRTWTSLSKLMETEQTLMLMCVLAQHWNTWVKAMKDTDSQLREMSIHLLAFISRGNQRLGEAPSRIPPLICPPILKDELDCCNKPSFVNSKNGWFALSPLGCISKPKFSGISTTALVIKDQATESNNYVSQTYFSDSVAIQIYRIAFLLLKFLCLQAEGAAKRAEELGYVDLAHFPELPMPEILHGIQDQAIAIVTELCETNRSKQIQSEVQQVCLLLLQTIEMALYLELCVLQICGIKPMLGRVEDVSKEVKLLMKATEGHAFLKGSMKSLSQIISLVYPGLP